MASDGGVPSCPGVMTFGTGCHASVSAGLPPARPAPAPRAGGATGCCALTPTLRIEKSPSATAVRVLIWPSQSSIILASKPVIQPVWSSFEEPGDEPPAFRDVHVRPARADGRKNLLGRLLGRRHPEQMRALRHGRVHESRLHVRHRDR